MQATLIPAVVPFPTGAAPRTEGVHLSGLIKAMAVDYGFLDPQYAEDHKLVEISGAGETWWAGLDEDAKIRMALGLAWEEWYLPKIAGVVHQPGERCLEGIYMTPDGHSLDYIYAQRLWKYVLCVHEVKVTTKSTNTTGDLNVFNAKNWMWLTQVACNCMSLGTDTAYLHILYLYGDYKRPFTPKLHVWRIQFDEKDLTTKWRQVRDYRDQKAAEGALQ